MTRTFDAQSKYESGAEVMKLAERVYESKNPKVLYKGKEHFIVCNNYNGTYDIAQGEGKSYVGEKVWLGVERAVEKDELEWL